MTDNLPTAINYDDPKMVATLKATVAKDATPEEFAMFAGLCRATGLNPFKKEVWFIKTKGYTKKDGTQAQPRVQIMTGINGFLAIANKHPQFDGLECDIERRDDGQPVRAVAKVWRKDRKFPAVAEALWSEHYRPNPYGNKGVWEQMPSIMLAKCAKSLALREAFPQELNGLYTEEEMPREYSAAVVAKPQPEAEPAPAPAQDATYYNFSEARLTQKQLAFLNEHCSYDEEKGLWACNKDLGAKLAKYRVMVGKTHEPPVSAEVKSEEDMPDWLKAADAAEAEIQATVNNK